MDLAMDYFMHTWWNCTCIIAIQVGVLSFIFLTSFGGLSLSFSCCFVSILDSFIVLLSEDFPI